MIVLDTNVLSAIASPRPDEMVVQWFNAQPPQSLCTTSVTLFEIRAGLLILPGGRRRAALERAFQAVLEEDLRNRILPFDSAAAAAAAAITARRRAAGIAIEIRDTQIAGIAASRRASVATRNTRHFIDLDVPVINPWTD